MAFSAGLGCCGRSIAAMQHLCDGALEAAGSPRWCRRWLQAGRALGRGSPRCSTHASYWLLGQFQWCLKRVGSISSARHPSFPPAGRALGARWGTPAETGRTDPPQWQVYFIFGCMQILQRNSHVWRAVDSFYLATARACRIFLNRSWVRRIFSVCFILRFFTLWTGGKWNTVSICYSDCYSFLPVLHEYKQVLLLLMGR